MAMIIAVAFSKLITGFDGDWENGSKWSEHAI